MTIETQTEFARRIGKAKSWVTKLKGDGRLVMSPEGLVDVEASLARIAQTGGGRPDVAERHAAERQAPAAAGGQVSDAGKGRQRINHSTLNEAKARKEAALAEQEEIKLQRMRGEVVDRETVDDALRFIGGAVRAAFDVLPDQTAPLVAPVTDLAEVHALLQQASADALAQIGEAVERQKRALHQEVTT